MTEWLLAACMLAAAALYTTVGHAGASAYLAIMALFGVAPAVMRPTALVLNILVAAVVSFRYLRAGLFCWRTAWPFLAGALPLAFAGGAIELPGHFYKPLVGVILLFAALPLLGLLPIGNDREPHHPPLLIGLFAGACIGLLSGLTGTGGGIFLSPLLILLGWSETRTTSGIAAVFILCNSAAGLLGNIASVQALPPDLPLFAAAVLLGAIAGTSLGIGRLAVPAIRKALGVVLVIAGLKLLASLLAG